MIDIAELGIDKVQTEFKIDEEKRTVVCIIRTVNDIPMRLAKYGLADGDYDEKDLEVRIYKGIAKCAPADEWDEVYGMRLAEYRASCARQKDVNKELKKYVKGILRCLDNLLKYGFLKNPHIPERD